MQTAEQQLAVEAAEAKAKLAYRWLLDNPVHGYQIVDAVLRWSQFDQAGVIGEPAEMGEVEGKRRIGTMFAAQIEKHYPEGWCRFLEWRVTNRRLVAQEAAREEREKAAQEPQ